MKVYTHEQVSKHNSKQDCWCIIHGDVYDLTSFLPSHPGGQKVILKEAGKDATRAFDAIHPKDIISRILPAESHIGKIDSPSGDLSNDNNSSVQLPEFNIPLLSQMINLFDFESVAKFTLTKEAFAYYSSGADDELTMQENHSAFHRIWLRPRVMVNVKQICTQTTLLGSKSNFPFYISATALGKLGHPEGEVVLTKAAGTRGIIQMIPTLASCSLDDIIDASLPNQDQWFQLYVNSDRNITKKLVQYAELKGAKALFITVDAPQLGRREKDMRVKFVVESPDVQRDEEHTMDRSQGAARAISSFIDPSLSWDDIKWFKSITKMPIILKGIQCAEDAVIAAQMGVSGIVVSNHGGRQLDTARSGIECLAEVMDALEAKQLNKRLEVYVDGGFKRGTDIFKALALGAKAVGIGRPFLYAMSAYGQKGVERAIDILSEELIICMRLMGCSSLADIKRNMIVSSSLSNHNSTIQDTLSHQTYQRLELPLVSKL